MHHLAQIPEIGEVVGPCKVLGLLGEGGGGTVYRAHHLRLGQEVALKIISARKLRTGSGVALERFKREAMIAARLNHPNVARVFDIDQDRGRHYIIQELVKGSNLESLVKSQGPLPEAAAARTALCLARGIAAIHAVDVVHRDLKPENVIITPSGEAKLIDFGIAKSNDVAQQGSLTHQDSLLGTPLFLAPEQLSRAEITSAADMFGLGAIVYFALVGESPFVPGPTESLIQLLARRSVEHAPDVRQKRPGLSTALGDLVGRLLATEPGVRPSAAEACRLLEAIQGPAGAEGPSALGSPAEHPARSTHGGLQGSLEDMPLAEILQSIEFNEKTGILEIEGTALSGRLTFQNGQPHQSDTSDGRSGSDAVLRLLAIDRGTFLLRRTEREQVGERSIGVSFTRILMDHARASDESAVSSEVEFEESAPAPVEAAPPSPRIVDTSSRSSSSSSGRRSSVLSTTTRSLKRTRRKGES